MGVSFVIELQLHIVTILIVAFYALCESMSRHLKYYNLYLE